MTLPDIADRRTRENSSRAEHYRRQLDAVANNATLALFIMDEHQHCTYMNPAAERLTGFTLDEVQGKPLHDYVHHTRPDGSPFPLEECPIDQAFPKNMREQGEEVFVHKDGHFYTVAFTASPVLENGTPVGTIIEVRDITEEKREQAERERLLEERARLAQEQTFLAEASEVLASSLDYDTTLTTVAHLAVQGIADWCAVDELLPSGEIRRVAVAHPDPEMVKLAHELQEKYPPDPEAPFGVPHILRTGEPELVEEIPDELLVASARDEEHLRIVRALGLRSYIAVPLIARGTVLGALSLVASESGRRFGERDLHLANELARRASIAIDNARLYRASEQARQDLEAQSVELREQAEELQHQAAELEEIQVELEVANDELMQANHQVEEARALLEAFFDAAPIAAGYLDRDLRYRRMNPTLAAIDGVDPAQVIGRSIHEVIPNISPEIEPLYRQVLATGEPIQNRLVTGPRPTDPEATGHYLVNYFPVTTGGEVQGVGLVALDVTEQRAAEEARREEARLIETLHRIGQSLASELDAERIVQAVTDETTALTGAQFGAFFYNVVSERGESYTLYSISGVPREAFSRFPMPRNTPIFAPTFHGTGVVRSDDITKDPRYGQVAPYHGMPEGHLPVTSYLAVPVISTTGEVLGGLFFGHEEPGVFQERHERLAVGIAGWAAVAMDNARLYQAEYRARSEAERANQVKSDFLATMSHELRTPLNAMIGYTDLLLAGIPEPVPPSAEGKVERIGVSARHLLALIEEILTFSRLEAGEEKVELETFDPGTLIQEVQALTEPLALAKGVDFLCHTPAEARPLESDLRKVRQILINLVGNAIKFTDAGEVRLELVEVGAETIFRVVDTGSGIAPEHLEKIFEPFWQVESGSRRTVGGTGLGLSVTRRLARLLGGDVTVESEAGKGSTFTLRLPAHAPPPPEPEA